MKAKILQAEFALGGKFQQLLALYPGIDYPDHRPPSTVFIQSSSNFPAALAKS